eukprot:GEMP01034284.1.p1 GENE.GEMP01034284.1~~GEMP01034284.1.p1  ORF type:complete len:219 (+),score=20.65 GEMP01034284.1:212-868(+)
MLDIFDIFKCGECMNAFSLSANEGDKKYTLRNELITAEVDVEELSRVGVECNALLSHRERDLLREMFAEIDRDRDNLITYKELVRYFQDNGSLVTQVELMELARFADRNQDGLINKDDFLMLAGRIRYCASDISSFGGSHGRIALTRGDVLIHHVPRYSEHRFTSPTTPRVVHEQGRFSPSSFSHSLSPTSWRSRTSLAGRSSRPSRASFALSSYPLP